MMEPVRWRATGREPLPGKLCLLDQTRLPEELVSVELDDIEAIRGAICRLVVRGAPAIGCAAALGLAAVCQHSAAETAAAFLEEVSAAAERLGSARPTAVNLGWALRRCRDALDRARGTGADAAALKSVLIGEALAILEEDKALCRSIGRVGVEIFGARKGMRVLTHCNAGGLATSGYGTALAPIYAAHEAGLAPRVYADETRPLLQGSRLTAWELRQAGVDVTVICDSMAAALMRTRRVGAVIVGADRIAANGDTANKIGTYGLAVQARHHGVPFYVAAPYSTIDTSIPDGSGIPIEERDPDEVRRGFGRLTAPADVAVWNPAFDVTPAALIDGIITEKGILRAPYERSIEGFLNSRLPGRPR
ncbi:MAG: S-methyl-5-thioribose-1-phosphate isomerase [Lentisphaeria bacterium]|nr:S-methyl-5-thioribose-1-phosphate isomerase [Lentisphaeria bacterium]